MNELGITIAENGECMVDSLDIVKDTTTLVKAVHRIDLKISFRVGDHIRLRSASPPKNMPFRRPRVLDGQVERSEQGALFIRLTQSPPPERCSWYVLPAGNTTTTRAMMKAIRTIAKQQRECSSICPKLVLVVVSKTTSPLEPRCLSPLQSQCISASCGYGSCAVRPHALPWSSWNRQDYYHRTYYRPMANVCGRQ